MVIVVVLAKVGTQNVNYSTSQT